MQLRKRKPSSIDTGAKAAHDAREPAPAPKRGLAAPAPAAAAAAAPPPTESTPDPLVHTPEAPAAPGRKKRARLPPVDIGIPQLLLGAGMEAAAAAADAVDALPLGQAGFTPQTLQAACEYLSKADPSKPWGMLVLGL